LKELPKKRNGAVWQNAPRHWRRKQHLPLLRRDKPCHCSGSGQLSAEWNDTEGAKQAINRPSPIFVRLLPERNPLLMAAKNGRRNRASPITA
jgi:hypothetical protein